MSRVDDSRKNAAAPARMNDGADSAGGGENLDKIRDILFGSQAREMDRAIARLEDRVTKEVGDLRDESRKRLDSLELYIKNEINSVIERLRVEMNERSKADKELGASLAETAKNLEKRLVEASDRTAEEHRELRKQILEQSKTLRDELRQNHDEQKSSLEKAAAELRHSKTDRFALADLFTEAALRLKDEMKLPKGR